MNELTLRYALLVLWGMLLGTIFFGGLWMTVRQMQQSRHPAVLFLGSVVVRTTIVLALGLGVSVVSHLPSLRQFGRLAGICLFASLIGQLVILPATIALYRRLVPKRAVA